MKKILIYILLYIFCISSVNAYQNKFYWGQCTWFIAQQKKVEWRGNAKDWLENAKVKGRDVGFYPIKDSIVVFDGEGYSSDYGHVAIVKKVMIDSIIVLEMNYSGLNKTSLRVVEKYDPGIKGYIY